MTLALVAMVSPTPGRTAPARRRARRRDHPDGRAPAPPMTSRGPGGRGPPGLRCLVAAAPDGGVRPAVGEAATGVVVAAALLAAVYPHVFAHPTLLVQSARAVRELPGQRRRRLPLRPVPPRRPVPPAAPGLLRRRAWSAAYRSRRGTGALEPAQVDPAGPRRGAGGGAPPGRGRQELRPLQRAAPAAVRRRPRGRCWSPSGWRSARLGAAPRPRPAGRWRSRVVALVAPDGRPGHALPLPVQLLQRRARRDRRARRSPTTGAPASPSCCPTIPTDGQIVCGPDPVDPARGARRAATRPRRRRGGDAGGPLLLRQQRRLPHRPARPAVAAVDRAGLPYDDALPHDEFYVVIDRDHARTAQLHAARVGDPAPALARGVDDATSPGAGSTPPPLDGPVAFTRPDGENMAPPLWAYAPEGWVMRDVRRAPSTRRAPRRASPSGRRPAVPGGVLRSCSTPTRPRRPRGRRERRTGPPPTWPPGVGHASRCPPGVADAWVTFTTHVRSATRPPGPHHPSGPHRDRLGDVAMSTNLWVVVPALNEAENLVVVVPRILAELDPPRREGPRAGRRRRVDRQDPRGGGRPRRPAHRGAADLAGPQHGQGHRAAPRLRARRCSRAPRSS